jgi:hypothetical protein
VEYFRRHEGYSSAFKSESSQALSSCGDVESGPGCLDGKEVHLQVLGNGDVSERLGDDAQGNPQAHPTQQYAAAVEAIAATTIKGTMPRSARGGSEHGSQPSGLGTHHAHSILKSLPQPQAHNSFIKTLG